MSRNEHDEQENLMQRLRDTLDMVSDEEDSPEDIFGDAPTATHEGSADEDIDAFDSYMAELLGEVLDDGDRTPPESRRKATSRRASAKKELEETATAIVEEQTEAMEPVEETDNRPNAQPSAYRDESDAIADEDLPQPDVRAELPGEIFEDYEDEPEPEEPTVEEMTAAEEVAPFEPIEQLTILDALPTPETVESDATEPEECEVQPEEASDEYEDTSYAAEHDMPSVQESDDGNAYSLETDVSETLTPDEIADDALPVAEEPTVAEPIVESVPEVETDEPTPLVLEQGDILLDAEDDIPPVLPKQPDESPVKAEDLTAQPVKAQEEPAEQPVIAPPVTDEPPKPKQSPLDTLAAQRQGNVRPVGGGNSPFTSRASRERTLTDDDVELLLDLGYDNHLTQKVGAQRIEMVRYRRQDDEKARRRIRNVYGCTGEEYSSHAQDKAIRATYRLHQRGATVRLVLSVILAVLALAVDLLPLLWDQLSAEVMSYIPTSGMYGLVGLVLLLLAAVVTLPYLKRGAIGLMKFSLVPSSMPVLLVLISLIYQLIGLSDEQLGVLLTFPTMTMLALLAIGERMNVCRERMTFDVVSAHSRKIVMVPTPPRKKKVVRDGHIVKIINDDAGRRNWRVRPTDQVAGYFRRNAQSTPRYRTLSVLLLIAVIAALVVSLLTLIVTEQLRSALTAFLLTLQASMPAAALISYAYPQLLAARKLSEQGCAIVGQAAVDEYAGEKTLLFDDTEMFRSKSSTEITIKGSGDTKKYIRYAKRLFRTLGGTLRGVSTSDLSEEAWEERVEILKVYEQGVEARIDDKVHIFAGTSAFMVSKGIRVPGESAELLVRRSVESCILYLAFDGKLRLGYEIDYRISGRFEQMVTELSQAGTSVAVETCDPNLHEDFLTRSRRVGSIPVSVVKPVRFERQTDSLLCDSGIVATRSARDAARATFTCDRLMENDARLSRFLHVATVLGAVVALALSLLGLVSMTVGFVAALLQVLWCLPVLMLSHRHLNNDEDSENEHANRNRE